MSPLLAQLDQVQQTISLLKTQLAPSPPTIDPLRLITHLHTLRHHTAAIKNAIDQGDWDEPLATLTGRHPYALHLEHHLQSASLNNAAQTDLQREITHLAQHHPQEAAHLQTLLNQKKGGANRA